MSKTKKIVLGVVAVAVLGIGTYFGLSYRERGVVKVQTGKVAKTDSLVQTVTASGEIKPLKYINITATSYGRVTEIPVKEGDRVKKGTLLMRQESVQPQADLASARAGLQQAIDNAAGQEAAYASAQASYEVAKTDLVRSQADYDRAKLDYDRYDGLLKEGIVSKSQYDQAKATYDVAKASVESSKSQILRAKALLNQADKARISAQSTIAQQKAMMARTNDQLDKTSYYAPLDAVITNLPVRAGESAVIGVQGIQGSGLMTLADLSVITSEVRVDETDINNVKLGQDAEITVDAIPNKTYKGKVTEVGSSAITRSGVAAGSGANSSQEAKDFKVVITIQDPTDELRPGLSSTAKITTATRANVLAIPIQALTIRELDKDKNQKKGSPSTAKAAGANDTKPAADAKSGDKKKKEEQGVFVVRNNVAVFVPVKTGITGQTEIEVLSGLKEGDEIITGSYKTLRTIQTDAKVKVDNKNIAKEEPKS